MAMDVEDKRKSRRSRMLQSGKIIYGKSVMIIECVIRDRSDDGARLKVSSTSDVPTQFRLFFQDSNTLRAARVVWKTDREIGIEFTGDAEDVRTAEDLKIRALRVHA